MKELLSIQAELKAPKNQFNSFGKYKYRSCEDILEGVKPLLYKYGCTLTLSDDIVNIGDRYYIKASAEISKDSETILATAFAREPITKKGMDDSQITGTASSYARKYALNGLFLIDDTKDADTMDNRDSEHDKQTLEHLDSKTIATLKKAWSFYSERGNTDKANFINVLSQGKKLEHLETVLKAYQADLVEKVMDGSKQLDKALEE